MFVFLGLYLHTLILPVSGQTITKADHSNLVPDSEGDLLFLLDSSGSITYDEFSKVKQFIGELLYPFKFGPRDVQASIVQISTNPSLEFPLNRYSSREDIQKAIQDVKQRMGDTNTGKALQYVQKNLHSEMFGSRADIPKVLVWMTDGLSTDDISWPMQLLKDMGVTVFIVSTTGRGNYQVLSKAASQPEEKYLKFVDKDDLGIITKELRDSIIELIKAKRLQALDITQTSFRLTWPRLLTRNTGHYTLEYAPVTDPKRKSHHTLTGDATTLILRDLTPNTTYQVTLLPESNIDYVHPQSINVSTLQDLKEERNLEAFHITTTDFRLAWSWLPGDTGNYILEYWPISDPTGKMQMTYSGDETSVVLSHLSPNTTYHITLISDSNDPHNQPESIQVSTLPDLILARKLKVLNITATSFNITWVKLAGDTGRYFLDYAPATNPRRKTRKTVYRDQSSGIRGLIPNTTYLLTYIPESNDQTVQSQTIPVTTLPDLLQTRSLHVLNITATSFTITWIKITGDTGRYFLDYAPLSDPRRKLTKTVYGDQSSVGIMDLLPNTTYQVTFTPETQLPSVQSQSIQVSTLPDLLQTRNLQVLNITATSFTITWLKITGDTGRYFLEYASISDPRKKFTKTVYGDQSSVGISGLLPDTTYQMTFTPESNLPSLQSQTIQVSTIPDMIQARKLQVLNITTRSFQIAWSSLSGDTGRYSLSYGLSSTPETISQISLYNENRDEIGNLMPNTTYWITFIPGSSLPYNQSQTIEVSTLPDLIQARNLQVLNIMTRSLHIRWSPLSGDTGRYTLSYGISSKPGSISQMSLYGKTNAVIGNLMPNTVYQITFLPESSVPNIQSQTIQVSTLQEPGHRRNLQASDITSTSFLLTWTRFPTDEGLYVLEYVDISIPLAQKRTLFGDEPNMVISGLSANTTYRVTLFPEYSTQYVQPESIQVATKPEVVQTRHLQVQDVTASSFQLTWSRVSGERGPYTVEYALVSHPNRKHRRVLPVDQTHSMLSNLSPNTEYQATVFSESNVQYVPPQSIQISTLLEPVWPAKILISDPTSHSFRVTWGPNHESIAGYEIQYGPLPSNGVKSIQVDSRVNSTVVEGLKSNTTYLVTVSAIFKSGGEKALSAIACTEKDDTTVKYLHFEDLGPDSMKATWGSAEGEVQGYRVRCRRQVGHLSVVSVSPQTHSVRLRDLPKGTTNRICVTPVYKNGAGKSLCKGVQRQPGTSANQYFGIQTH